MPRPSDKRPAIVLTGFGPFPGIAANASGQLVETLGRVAANRFPKKRIVAHVLPTKWDAAPKELAALYRAHTPILMLHFGVSERAKGFQVEAQAHNVQSPFRDAADNLPEHPIVARSGQDKLSAKLPVDLIVSRLKDLSVPASLSQDAGTYLCNAVLYRSLQWAERTGSMAGFIHMPARYEAALFDFDTALRGGLEIIRASLGLPASVNRPKSHGSRHPG